MGYMRHHAIVVTGRDFDESVAKAHSMAEDTFGDLVSPVVMSGINGFRSFCVFPDGSKEGWEKSLDWDDSRDSFISYLKEFEFEDGSSPLCWVEVQYGDDNYETMVVRDSDMYARGNPSD